MDSRPEQVEIGIPTTADVNALPARLEALVGCSNRDAKSRDCGPGLTARFGEIAGLARSFGRT